MLKIIKPMNLFYVIAKNFIWRQGSHTTRLPYLNARFEIRIIFLKSLSIGTETSNVVISF